MISNDERREVAARLRKQKPWDICTEYKYCIGNICDAVFEDEGDLNDMFILQKVLADLIDPEPERTCRYKHIEGTWYKTSCGERYDGVVPPNYCPNCGAKVTNDEG